MPPTTPTASRTSCLTASSFHNPAPGSALLLQRDGLNGVARPPCALGSLVIAKGDNGRWQPNYSSVGGDLAAAAISNLYYPKSARGIGLVLQGFAINSMIHAGVRLMDELFFRPAGCIPVRKSTNAETRAIVKWDYRLRRIPRSLRLQPVRGRGRRLSFRAS